MMRPILLYLLFTTLLWLLYRTVFQRLSFYRINRLYLLSIPLLAFALVQIGQWTSLNNELAALSIELPEISIEGWSETPAESTSIPSWTWIYFIGLFTSLSFFAYQLGRIREMIRSAQPKEQNGRSYSESTRVQGAFNFFQHVVLPHQLDDKAREKILLHEWAHKKCGHSWDYLLCQLYCCLTWFNPVQYLIYYSLKQNNECEADSLVLENTSREEYAQLLLSQTFGTEVAIPAPAFFNPSFIKNRIQMLYTEKNKANSRWIYAAVLPLLLAMAVISCSKAGTESDANSTENASTEQVMDFSVAEQPPLWDNCNEKASKEDQVVCFQRGLITRFVEDFTYPESAKKAGTEGKIYLQFVVDKSGKISDMEVVRSLTDAEGNPLEGVVDVEREALATLGNMDRLSPAVFNNTPVAVRFVLPISLKIPSEEQQP